MMTTTTKPNQTRTNKQTKNPRDRAFINTWTLGECRCFFLKQLFQNLDFVTPERWIYIQDIIAYHWNNDYWISEEGTTLFSKVNSRQSLIYMVSRFDSQKFSLKPCLIISLNQMMLIWVQKVIFKQLANAVTPVMGNTQWMIRKEIKHKIGLSVSKVIAFPLSLRCFIIQHEKEKILTNDT